PGRAVAAGGGRGAARAGADGGACRSLGDAVRARSGAARGAARERAPRRALPAAAGRARPPAAPVPTGALRTGTGVGRDCPHRPGRRVVGPGRGGTDGAPPGRAHVRLMRLRSLEAHVWLVSLTVPPDRRALLARLLSPDA